MELYAARGTLGRTGGKELPQDEVKFTSAKADLPGQLAPLSAELNIA